MVLFFASSLSLSLLGDIQWQRKKPCPPSVSMGGAPTVQEAAGLAVTPAPLIALFCAILYFLSVLQ